MANKIIGFFNSNERARQVENDLVSAGFGRTDVHIYEGNDEPGLWDRMREWFGYADEDERYLYHEAARRGGVAVVCDTSDDDTPTADKAIQIMKRHNPIDLDTQSAQWRKEGWQGYPAGVTRSTATSSGTAGAAISGQKQPAPTTRPAATGRTAGESESIPVVREELHVSKRSVIQGGVRIHSRVTERPVEKQVDLREEHVQVERRPADRPVRPGERAFEERTIEATETSERAVVNKEAKVVEEINVRKDVSQRTETVRDTVRNTDVDVEKLSGDRPGTTGSTTPGRTTSGPGIGAPGAASGVTAGSGFAGQTAYEGSQGRDFDATGFVTEMNRDRRYSGKEWDACEADYRKAYEQRYPQSKWDQVKDKVRSEYNRARTKI